jgi:hypothetical protein
MNCGAAKALYHRTVLAPWPDSGFAGASSDQRVLLPGTLRVAYSGKRLLIFLLPVAFDYLAKHVCPVKLFLVQPDFDVPHQRKKSRDKTRPSVLKRVRACVRTPSMPIGTSL